MRRIILRDGQHKLLAAFRAVVIEATLQTELPEIMFWRGRTFTFSTMVDDALTYSEVGAFSLVDGMTATPLTPEEMAKIPSVEPVIIFNG